MTLIKMQELRQVPGVTVASAAGGGGSSTSDKYDFGIDTDEMTSLISDSLGENAEAGKLIGQVRDSLYKIFNLINTGFGEAWNDDGYRQFAESCNSYADSVYGIVSFMETYSGILSDVLEASETLTKSVSTVVEDCEAGR